MWAAAGVAGLLTLVTGLLPLHDAGDVTARVGPVLGFLVAVTVLAELSERAEVFEQAADAVARAARGSVPRLFLMVCGVGAITTILLSLDTTAVLLTPVVLALAARLELPPLPFAMTAVWLANTASLLLPVSNLTNLLAADKLGMSASTYVGKMLLPAGVAIVATVLVLRVRFRRELRGRFLPQPRRQPADRVLFIVSAVCCVGFGPAVIAGVPAWAAATPAAAVTVGAFAWRRRSELRFRLVPWRLVILVEGLFLVVSAAGRHGLDRLLHDVLGGGGTWRVGSIAAAAANAFNNLPAYLALERQTSRHDLLALLCGVNIGPLVLLWGSLATLLWRERCKARGLDVSAREFATLGVIGVPVVLAATLGALSLT
ncbi:MAG TPA: SLC13 family permease [Frankiaceae bacterium]|nr:SLC13 family permease [Frankiaceae bacterium]